MINVSCSTSNAFYIIALETGWNLNFLTEMFEQLNQILVNINKEAFM